MAYVGVSCDCRYFDLRSSLLLFDQIAMPELSIVLRVWSGFGNEKNIKQKTAELEWLAKNGIVEIVPDRPEKSGLSKEDYENYLKIENESQIENAKLSEFFDGDNRNFEKTIENLNRPESGYLKEIFEGMYSDYINFSGDNNYLKKSHDLNVLRSYYLNKFVAEDIMKRDGSIAIPLQAINRSINFESCSSRTEVLNIAVNSIPFPSQDTPFEKFIDFRSDPDIRVDFLEMHKWASTTAKSEKKPIEIHEEVEYLIERYKKHLKTHKLEHEPGSIGTVLTVVPEILENILKVKWGDAAKLLFTFRKRKVALLKAESSAPGKELAYLVKASETLKS